MAALHFNHRPPNPKPAGAKLCHARVMGFLLFSKTCGEDGNALEAKGQGDLNTCIVASQARWHCSVSIRKAARGPARAHRTWRPWKARVLLNATRCRVVQVSLIVQPLNLFFTTSLAARVCSILVIKQVLPLRNQWRAWWRLRPTRVVEIPISDLEPY